MNVLEERHGEGVVRFSRKEWDAAQRIFDIEETDDE